jgi:SIR2-like domain
MNIELVTAIRDQRAILFVGSGVSASLGIPTWNGLVQEPDVFESLGASYLTVAEYYELKMGGIGKLRSWMDRKWSVEDAKLRSSRVHNLIVDLTFPLIYTTNYDRFIEESYRLRGKNYHKVVGLRDLTEISSGTQIVKLHGDFDADSSLVIAESDYFDRLNFESPLDIRLRADVLGKTILFVGYSLSDINVRLLLYKMWKMWSDSGYQSEQPKSFVFLPKPDEIQNAVLENWGVHTITADVDDPNEALCAFLEELKEQVESIS